MLLRLRQLMGESLRARLATLPPAPAAALGLILDEHGAQRPVPAAAVTEGEAFRDVVHDLVREHVVTLSSYSGVLTARDRWAKWARRASWAALLLAGWQVTAAALMLCVKVFGWGWPTKAVMLTLVPTGVLVAALLSCLLFALYSHDRIMDARRAYDPL